MKKTITALLLSATPIFAGEPAPMAPAPAPAPALYEWFVAGSYGQFNDVGNTDTDMYALSFGKRFASYEGFNFAAYLEVDYLDGSSENISGPLFSSKIDTDVVPLTANVMVERNLFGGLGMYLGGGIGYAWTSVDTNPDLNIDENGGFYGQVSMGLEYSFNESISIFGGARWIYLGDLEWGSNSFTLPSSSDNSWGWEAGLRFRF